MSYFKQNIEKNGIEAGFSGERIAVGVGIARRGAGPHCPLALPGAEIAAEQ
jgi:hypothetical protein